MSKPKLSVLMPVYNAEPFLQQAIESILNQTFTDFEFLIIDDCSTDTSLQIINSYNDKRIRVINHKTNQGLIATLNEGIGLAKAPLIARMDADDISRPMRFEKQLSYLNTHAETVALGTEATVISADNRILYEQVVLKDDFALKRLLAVACPLVHGSVIFNRSAVLKAGGYRKEAYLVEDYDLWHRLSKVGPIANLKESLYCWRYNAAGESLSKSRNQRQAIRRLRDQIWAEFPAEGPAPKSIWPNIWSKDLLATAPAADHRRQLALFHIYFARGYFCHKNRLLGSKHLIAAWQTAPLILPLYYYYFTIPLFTESALEGLENTLVQFYAKLKNWQ